MRVGVLKGPGLDATARACLLASAETAASRPEELACRTSHFCKVLKPGMPSYSCTSCIPVWMPERVIVSWKHGRVVPRYGRRRTNSQGGGLFLRLHALSPWLSCRQGRISSSICCLPLVSPLSRVYMIWSSWILILDMTYTAFLVRAARDLRQPAVPLAHWI